jgi:hypothetical protein
MKMTRNYIEFLFLFSQLLVSSCWGALIPLGSSHICKFQPWTDVPRRVSFTITRPLHASQQQEPEDDSQLQAMLAQWEPEKITQVGNLCADDEWMGLSMELTELVRVAVIEEVKKNARDFLGKDNYKVRNILIHDIFISASYCFIALPCCCLGLDWRFE